MPRSIPRRRPSRRSPLEIIERLGLVAHPEGGHFREIYRSPASVRPGDDRGHRAALTVIWFLLARGEHSRWHRIASDEVWHHHDGGPLELLWVEEGGDAAKRVELAAVGDGGQPVAVVPAGAWQAARPLGDYALVGCTVAPGFDFTDFSLLADDAAASEVFARRFPALADLI